MSEACVDNKGGGKIQKIKIPKSRAIQSDELPLSDSNPMVLFDSNGQLLRFNHAICDLTGYDPAELFRMSIADLITGQISKELKFFQETPEQIYIERFTEVKTKRGDKNPITFEIRRAYRSTFLGRLKEKQANDLKNVIDSLQKEIDIISHQTSSIKCKLKHILKLFLNIFNFDKGYIAVPEIYNDGYKIITHINPNQNHRRLLSHQLKIITDLITLAQIKTPVLENELVEMKGTRNFSPTEYQIVIPIIMNEQLAGIIGLGKNLFNQEEWDSVRHIFTNVQEVINSFWESLLFNSTNLFFRKVSFSIDKIQTPLIITDSKGNIQALNRACEKLLGSKVFDLIGKQIEQLLIFESRASSLKKPSYPSYLEKKNLNAYLVNTGTHFNPLKVTVVSLNEGKLFLFQLKEHNKGNKVSFLNCDSIIIYQHQRLIELGTMAGSVAHEINNPITGIINYAQLISQRSKEEIIREYAKEIISEGNRVSRLVINLLNFSRQDSNEMQVISPTEIVEDSVSLMRPILRKDDIEIVQEFSDNLPSILCVPQKISQVIINLLSNARYALNEKYPQYDLNKKIIIKVKTINLKRRKWLRISIMDFGIGIQKSVGKNIFKPFYTTRSKNGGTGLGLALCMDIIQQHKGQLSYDSKFGEYTQFFIDLPIELTDTAYR